MATTTDISLDTHTKRHFPTLINLNARSMSSEKVDETPAIVDLHNVSIVCITETWFTEYVGLLRRVLDIHCQIDSSQCLAQLTPARVGKARSVHVQLGASPHVIR